MCAALESLLQEIQEDVAMQHDIAIDPVEALDAQEDLATELTEDQEEQPDSHSSTAEPVPRKGSAAFYISKQHCLLYPGWPAQ